MIRSVPFIHALISPGIVAQRVPAPQHRIFRRFQSIAIGAVIPLGVLALWSLAVALHLMRPQILPSPIAVWQAGIDLLRGGDLLVAYLATNPKPHFKTEAGLRLAEIGDLRAAPVLAWRMHEDPLKLYNKVDDPELRRDDNERRVSARMLADLAVMYPDKVADLRKTAEDNVVFWLTDLPQPQANGMRFLATGQWWCA